MTGDVPARRARSTPEAAGSGAHRLAGLAVVAALVVFTAGLGWALAAPGVSYGWRRSMVSDLGAVGCAQAAGRWICSERHLAFNVGQVLAGTLLLLGAWWSRGAGSWPRTAALVSAGVGLVLLGVFPSDVAHGLHMAGAVLALPGTGACLVLGSAVLARRPGPSGAETRRRLASGGLGVVVLLVSAIHLVPGATLRGVAELVSLVAVYVALLLEAGALVSSTTRGADAPPGVGALVRPPGDGRRATGPPTRRSGPGT